MEKSSVQIFTAQHLIPIEGDPLSPGALAIQGERILAVENPQELRQKYPEAQIQEFPDKTLMPGLVNAHADLSTTDFNQYPQEPFETKEGDLLFARWLVALSRFKASLSLTDQQNAVRRGLEITRTSGVTTLGDVCRYPIAVPLYEQSGLRVVVLAEVENIQRKMAQEDFEQALALIDEVQHGPNSRLTAGLAPFSAYTLSKNLLRILANHALQQGIPLHLNAALSFSEMEFFYDSLGEISAVLFQEAGWQDKIPSPHRMTPVQYLQEIGLLKCQPAIVGCVHLGPTDHAILQNAGCLRIFAPLSFQYLKVGELPWTKIFSDKIPFALGTLGRASGATLNLWDELRAVFFEVEEEDRSQIAQILLQAATLEGARALGLEKQTGSLVKNKLADFILVDTPEGDDSVAAGLIDQTRAKHIAEVYVGGKNAYRR